nr:endo-1,4-beta-xylanase [uncultured bacterium]
MSDRRKVLEAFEEQKDFMNEKVAYGIENYRKGDAKITVVGKDGKAIPGAKVKVNQKSHEFRFGANIFMLDELETEEKNEKYKAYFKKCFNTATIGFYWDTLEPEEGKPRYAADSPFIYRRPPIDSCVEFCEENGITPKAHCLNYDHFSPEWVRERSVPEIKEALIKRFESLAERYGKRIPCWEVFNELLIQNGTTPFYNEEDLMRWSFAQAERYFPENTLMVNESNYAVFSCKHVRQNVANCRNPYFMLCEKALAEGCRVDAVGMQFHFFIPKEFAEAGAKMMFDLKHHYAVLDQMAKLGKPLQITEVTIPAYSNDAEDEEIQAEIIKILYSIWFSHPNVEQIIYWNLVDGYAHVGNPNEVARSQGNMTEGENQFYGGLVRFDLTPKPAYHTVKNLFEKQWHTEETLNTDEGGSAFFRGFYGTYDVEIELNGKRIVKEIDLHKNGRSTFELVLPSNLK